MSDPAHKYTDDLLDEFEEQIKGIYEETKADLVDKAKSYLDDFAVRKADMDARLASGEISKFDYNKWRKRENIAKARYVDLLDYSSKSITDANHQAMSLLGTKLPYIAAENANYASFNIEKKTKRNINFALQDPGTVKTLLSRHDKYLPNPNINIPKDLRWNKKQLSSALTKGILTGESVPDIAKRIAEVASEGSAMRVARTCITAAENAGRIASYEAAEDLGIELKKEWLATLDERTRQSHRELDGEQVGSDEPFSNGCMYPGDPNCDDYSEIANCRCTLIAVVEGIDTEEADRWEKLPDGMTYDQWKYTKTNEAKLAKQKKPYISPEAKKQIETLKSKKYKGILSPYSVSDYTVGEVIKFGLEDQLAGEIKFFTELVEIDSESEFTTKLAKAKELQADIATVKKLEKGESVAVAETREAAVKKKAATKKAAVKKILPKYEEVDWRDYDRLCREQYSSKKRKIEEWGKRAAKKLSDAELSGLRTYTGGDYREMNRFKRTGEEPLFSRDFIMNEIANVDKAFENEVLRLQEDTYLFMETSDTAMKKLIEKYGKAQLIEDGSIAVGETWFDKAYLSTTISPDGSYASGNGCIIHIRANKGTPAAYVESFSQNKNEEEMLFKSGQKFIVRNVARSRRKLGTGRVRTFWELWIETIN